MISIIDLLSVALLVSLIHGAYVNGKTKKQLKSLECLNSEVANFIERLGADQKIFIEFKMLKLYSVNQDENTATIKFNTAEDLEAFIESRETSIEIKAVKEF